MNSKILPKFHVLLFMAFSLLNAFLSRISKETVKQTYPGMHFVTGHTEIKNKNVLKIEIRTARGHSLIYAIRFLLLVISIII